MLRSTTPPCPLLDQLEAAPHDAAHPEFIVQADGSVDATLIERIGSTAVQAGFPVVLFAVKDR